MKKKLLGLFISVLLFNIVFSGCFEETKKSKTIYVDDSGLKDYTSIQDAINAANPGDTVYVYNGIYTENIVINKTINFLGEDRNNTIINGSSYKDVLHISTDHVKISGFLIQNSGNNPGDAGIDILSNYSSITNTITNNNWIGINLLNSSNNTISSNTINNNRRCGICFVSSSNNTIYDNTINNNGDGIDIYSSSNNVISKNTINNSEYGIYLYNFSKNVISRNTINNSENGIDFWLSSNNTIYDNTIQNNDQNDIDFYYSNSNTIYNNTINNSKNGIYFYYSSKNVISSNIINNNWAGINFWNSSINTIYDNTIQNNNGNGIDFYNSSKDNLIYHNNLRNNTLNAKDEGINTWYNTTLKDGNYWDDYKGIDADGNGIGDIPYNVSGGDNQDLYPLINLYDI